MRNTPLMSAVLALAFAASAGESDLDSLRLGKLVCGPALTIEQCKGNVVMVEYWGTH